MEKPFSITKRKRFTVLIRVKLNWRHRQSSTHPLARVERDKCSLPPLCFPLILTSLLYTRSENVTPYFWILTSRLTRGGWSCCWYRRQNYVEAQSCELICMYKRIQVSWKMNRDQGRRIYGFCSQNLFNSNFNVIRSCFEIWGNFEVKKRRPLAFCELSSSSFLVAPVDE